MKERKIHKQKRKNYLKAPKKKAYMEMIWEDRKIEYGIGERTSPESKKWLGKRENLTWYQVWDDGRKTSKSPQAKD